ncbi:M67 family metallopeptidase [Anaerolineales bacterium]
MQVQLSRDVQKRIFEQLEANFPNEGGGFLMGRVEKDVIKIEQVRAVENTFEAEEQYHRYAMTPADWMALEDEADEQGLSLVGYYHSHPNSPAIPSQYDVDHALPNFVYIITQVQEQEAIDMRVYRLSEDRKSLLSETLIIN